MIHKIKVSPTNFSGLITGFKCFEVRFNDRDYKVNDILVLMEYDINGYLPRSDDACYTGRCVTRRITWVLAGGVYGVEKGYVVLSIVPV